VHFVSLRYKVNIWNPSQTALAQPFQIFSGQFMPSNTILNHWVTVLVQSRRHFLSGNDVDFVQSARAQRLECGVRQGRPRRAATSHIRGKRPTISPKGKRLSVPSSCITGISVSRLNITSLECRNLPHAHLRQGEIQTHRCVASAVTRARAEAQLIRH